MEHHGAYAFLIYYVIWIIWKGRFIIGGENRYLVLLSIIFGIFPDFDGLYYFIKNRLMRKFNKEVQHHFYSWTHWPLSYFPLVILFIVSLVIGYYPEFFLTPVVSIYVGHFIFDSISSGDGIMWGKIPWKKRQYARYINLLPDITDGYHDGYWAARYRNTIIAKIGNFALIISIIIIAYFIGAEYPEISWYYVVPIVFFITGFFIGVKRPPKRFFKEPPEGRYVDYRIKIEYINGLNAKNKKRHIDKYEILLKKKGVMEKINSK
ncbi:MAG: hypothetical protein ACQERB_10905 [Promethearchaeati archaeon]